jgi:two-component system nitrogen regulation sensor histidine kinase NtrY
MLLWMARSLTPVSLPSWQRIRDWLRRPDVQSRLAFVLAGAAALSGLATVIVLSGWLSFGTDVELVVGLLYLDITLLLLLGAVVARRLVNLFQARWQRSAGSRLHARLVALFSLVAVAPAILVAVFSLMFLHYGLEEWFSDRVSATLNNSLNVAQAYLDEHKDIIRADALAMAADLNREAPGLASAPQLFQRLLDAQAALRSLTEAMVVSSDGQVIARTGLAFMLDRDQLPPEAFAEAAEGEVVLLTSDTDDRVRALVRLDSFIDAYLFVGRFVDARVLDYLDRTRAMVDEYTLLEMRRSGIEVTFALIFGVVALLLLLAAVWVGLAFANTLATPISRLIAAADRVREGDLEVRVPEQEQDDEIDHLSRAFNRMTDQLAGHQAELVERSRFTVAVLSGVSAGVIGLDRQGRINLANPSAIGLLEAPVERLVERPLISVLPEVAGLLASVATAPDRPSEAQIEINRNHMNFTLLVRVAAQTDDIGITGYVVTFDDVSELLNAQRKAAWAEIARRIAHEIKNPLTPIRLSAERLKRKYLRQIETDREAFVTSADTIVRQVDTIGRLINEFSAFARMPAPVFAHESANELVRQAVHLQETARPGIDFETRLPAGDVRLYCDARQVAQALTNLLQNAVEAILERPEGNGHDNGRGWVAAELSVRSGEVVIEVSDNGRGLPAEPLERLTEPYVTTRSQGTGLGLAIVRKIMEEHGGVLVLDGRAGGGARVSLVFPIARGAATPPAVTTAAE